MHFTLKTIVAATVALSAFAAPSKLLTVQKYSGKVVPDSYIVRLKAGVDKNALLDSVPALRESVTHADWSESFFHGFAGTFNTALLNKLRASDEVESIAEDGIVTTQAIQENAPWNLAFLNYPPSGTNTYCYPDQAGEGVDVYIVDTGILLNHTQFGGRAKWGWSGSGLATTDDNGHGTHVSGIVAGVISGVAKKANIIAVKVLNGAGSGTLANVVGGFNYVRSAAAASGRPSVANASLGGGASTSIDDAVAALVASGVHTVVAAGNSNVDAGNTSPARVASAITVGALDMSGLKASFSNYGNVVDIWAPGASIPSTYNNGGTATLSGTSMAAPHVAGAAALYISVNGNTSPSVLASNLWSRPGSGIVTRILRVPCPT